MKKSLDLLGAFYLVSGVIGSFFLAHALGGIGRYDRNWPLTIGIFVGCLINVFLISSVLFALSEILGRVELIQNKQMENFSKNDKVEKEKEEKTVEKDEDKAVQEMKQILEYDTIQKMKVFATKCSECSRFVEMRQLWDQFEFAETEDISDIKKELIDNVYIERMYGGTTKEGIMKFIELIENKIDKSK